MSSVDFKQEAKHHGFIHIVLRNLGEKPSSFFDTVLKALTELRPIQSKGTVLFLRVLNSQELPPWALGGPKWSDFCAHKQILGVVGVCMCRDPDDLDNMLAGFKLYTAELKNKLCESRCIIYGSKTELEGGNIDPKKGHCLIDYNTMNETPNDIKQGSLIKIIEQLALSIYKNLKNEIDELEKSINVGNSPVKFLRSPFESKDANCPEDDSVSDSRSVAAQSKARMMKHIADLSLLAGDHQMAFMWYSRAKQTKQAQNVWYAAMIEGLAVTRIIIKLCEEVLGQKAVTLSSSTLSRIPKTLGRHGTNSSTGALPLRYPLSDYTRQTPMSSSDIAQASKFATIRRPQNSAEGDTAIDKHNGGLVFKPINSVKQQDPFSSSAASEEDESGVEEADEEEDGESYLQVDQEMLHKDFAVDKYTDALRVYDKAKSTEPVAYLEALLKFSKYLVDQECYLRASKQLQRMIESDRSFISDTDKLQLYCTLAEIYESMRFHRKAALFTYYAAGWANNFAQSPKQVSKAYALAASCLSGYKLSQQLSDLLKKEESAGWPLLQAQVLKDFVFLSRRENDDELAISHSCYLLQYLAKLLSRDEILQITTMLGQISKESKKAQQSSTPSATIARTLCSPLPLENFPCVKSVQLIELVDLLKPIKIEGFIPPTPKKTSAMSENSQSPFIFSPFEAKRRKGKQRPEVLWVVGNPGEVLLIVENTLPFDLRVTSMLVHVETEGSKVATYPASLTLPTESEPQDIKLLTVPSEPGLLDIKGYEATVFGIRYECKVKIPGDPIVRVVAPLPEICLRLFPALPASQECPLSPSLRVSKASITELELLDGETFECEFQIDCLSKGEKDVDVEQVTLTLKDYDKDYCDISWDDSAIKAMLPLSRGCSGSFVVSICGKIPAWFRVLNEYTQGISKTTVFPDLKMESRQSSTGSSHHSYSANTTPTESPTSSPVAKRSSLLKSSNAKTKLSSTRSSGSEFSFSKESSLMDSLNLDHPALTSTRNSNTLPNFRRSPGHQRNTSLGGGSTLGRQKHRGSKKFKFSNDNVWDEKRFSMVSTRSDPGEEWRNRSKTKGSEQAKAIQIPKTAETRASPYGNSPQPYDHGSASSSQSNSIMSRTSFGNKNVGTRKQTVVTKGSISVPVGPLIRQKPQPPSRRKIEAKFTIQYTGGRGYLEGYCRQCFAKLQIVVKPCLVFEQFDIVSNKQSREFFNLKFSVHNTSKSRMEVSIFVEQDSKSNEDEGAVSLALDPNGIKEVVLVIKRFVLTANDSESDDERALTNLYSERVSKMVKVHWKDLEYDKMGVVSLNGLRLPVSTLSLLKPLPLLFGSSLNGQSYSLQLSHSRECDLGDKVKLTVMLTNSSGVCMPPSFLLFEPNFHFQQQKRMLKDLSQMLLHTGSLVVNVPQLDPGKTYEHELTLVFLLKGNYWVEVKSYMQVESTPSFQAKIPTITSALPVETKTVSESTAAGAKGTSEPPPPVEPVMSPNRSSSGTDTLSLTELLSPTYDRSGVFSPPPRSTSPRRSPGFRRHLSSPDSPNTKAIQMAKLYEAKVAARETTVYKGLTPHPTNKKIVDSSSEKSSSSERNSLKDSTSDSVEDMAPDTNTKASDPPQPQSQNSSPAKQKRTIIDYNNISTLLSEFVPKDSLPKVSTASPVQVTSLNNPTPPPLPRGYHGTLTSDYIRGEKPVRNFKQDRFQQLLRLRAQSSKTVQVISGPQFLFSVS